MTRRLWNQGHRARGGAQALAAACASGVRARGLLIVFSLAGASLFMSASTAVVLGQQTSAGDTAVPRRGGSVVAAPDAPGRLGHRVAATQGEGAGAGGDGARQQLERRIRVQFERIVRRRLGLTDEQVDKLRASNQRFAPERRALTAREREIRQAMRAELRPGVTPDERRLAVLTDSLFRLQRSRLDLVQSEQRDLAGFLTPSQRLRYYALQEQLRRRVQTIMRRRQGANAGLGPGDSQ